MPKSGFVSIIGKPNVGKSTFLNAVLNEKIAITSSKPQTTRYRLEGIYHSDQGQIIFVDTPGIHEPKHPLGEKLVQIAKKSFADMDGILYMVNAVEPFDDIDASIIESFKALKTPVILVMNKLDLAHDLDRLEAHIAKYKARYDFHKVVAISAKDKIYTDQLIEDVFDLLDEGILYYPEAMKTTRSKRFLMAELIREKILNLTQQEVPHSVFVEIERIDRAEDNLLEVYANIVVEKKSQKGIIIGKGGALIKKIGRQARLELKPLLGEKLFLDLHVKVIPDWRFKTATLNQVFAGDFE